MYCYDIENYSYEDEKDYDPVNEFLTPKEVMELLAIGRSTFYRLVNSGELPSFRIGKNLIRVKREDIYKKCPNKLPQKTTEHKLWTAHWFCLLIPKNLWTFLNSE